MQSVFWAVLLQEEVCLWLCFPSIGKLSFMSDCRCRRKPLMSSVCSWSSLKSSSGCADVTSDRLLGGPFLKLRHTGSCEGCFWVVVWINWSNLVLYIPCLIGLTSVLVYEVTVFRGQSLDGDNLLLTPYLNSQSRKVLSYSPFYWIQCALCDCRDPCYLLYFWRLLYFSQLTCLWGRGLHVSKLSERLTANPGLVKWLCG